MTYRLTARPAHTCESAGYQHYPIGIDVAEQFRNAIQTAGLMPPETIVADGKLRRFPSAGKKGDDAGWYVLHADGVPAGSFGCWRTGLVRNWHADVRCPLSSAEIENYRARLGHAKTVRAAEHRRINAEAAEKAEAIWKAALPATDSHSYLLRKGIQAHGTRLHRGALVIPLRIGDQLHSLQFIDADGDMRFLKGGRVRGCYFSLGDLVGASAICITEGFATGATVHQATGLPVAVAFNAGNLASVAQAMRESFPQLPIILCADDDKHTDGNPGMCKAQAAARLVRGVVALPDFGGTMA